MADISDVENALVSLLAQTIYPLGADQSSIIGSTCRIYRGWPNAATLNNDLNSGIINISVTTDSDSGRLTTRYLPKLQASTRTSDVSVVISGDTTMIGGQPASGDLIGLIVDGVGYSYRIQASDTVDMVAANLAQTIEPIRPAIVSGSNIVIPGARHIVGRVVADGTITSELRRQEKDCRVICWCPSPEIRDTVCLSIDTTMAQLTFISLENASFARVTYKNTASFDQAEDALLYRRDLVFTIEYPTISNVTQPSMLFGDSGLNGTIKTG